MGVTAQGQGDLSASCRIFINKQKQTNSEGKENRRPVLNLFKSSLESGCVGLIPPAPPKKNTHTPGSRAVLFFTPVPCSLFSGTETVRACSHPVAYPLIASVSTCKVGEHGVCFPSYLVTSSLRCDPSALIISLVAFPGKRQKRMLHSFPFLPELLSLLGIHRLFKSLIRGVFLNL